jgi:hypothetical protein
MALDEERLDQIRARAVHAFDVLTEARGDTVEYDLESITWVEGFIERARAHYAAGEIPESMIATIGCYLGEAIIAETGGEWADDEVGGTGVVFPNGDMVFPLTKVARQFELGLEGGESILSFYSVAVSYIAIGGLPVPEDAAEPSP